MLARSTDERRQIALVLNPSEDEAGRWLSGHAARTPLERIEAKETRLYRRVHPTR